MKKLSTDLISLRTELLIKFTKKFISGSSSIKYTKNIEKGSLAYNFLKCKNLVLASSKDKILDEKVKDLGSGGCPSVNFNRNKASVFATEGKVDHDGTETMFGQAW